MEIANETADLERATHMLTVRETMPAEHWHLSKSVPISIIGAVVLQTFTIVWYIAGLNAAVQSNTRDIDRQDGRIAALEAVVQGQAVSMARMDENIQAIRDIVEQLAGKP